MLAIGGDGCSIRRMRCVRRSPRCVSSCINFPLSSTTTTRSDMSYFYAHTGEYECIYIRVLKEAACVSDMMYLVDNPLIILLFCAHGRRFVAFYARRSTTG